MTLRPGQLCRWLWRMGWPREKQYSVSLDIRCRAESPISGVRFLGLGYVTLEKLNNLSVPGSQPYNGNKHSAELINMLLDNIDLMSNMLRNMPHIVLHNVSCC